jgi:HlyD family secretion protein
MNKKKLWIILGISALVALIVVVSVVKSGPKGFEVEAVKVAKGDVSPMVTADGLITAKDTVNLSSQVMGEIVSIPFQEGARVHKGDVLVQINPDTYQRDVASAKANLDASMVAENQARVTLTQRQRDWDRAEDLFKQKIFSTSQRDDAKLALDQARLSAESARAMAQQARAYFQKAQDNLAKTTMLSPIDGVVTAVNAKEGETAVMGTMNFAGTVILTVSDLSQIITEVQVDEADYPRLRLGQPVIVIVDALGGKKYDGKVIEIGASAQASAAGAQANIRQFKVKVAITSADEQLRPGVTARVKLIADKRSGVLRVPIGAIRTEEKSGEQVFFVFLDKQGKAAKKVVNAGLSDDLYTEVTEGLAQDDAVIIGPYRVLRLLAEGDRVKAKILKAEELEKKQKSDEVEVHVS